MSTTTAQKTPTEITKSEKLEKVRGSWKRVLIVVIFKWIILVIFLILYYKYNHNTILRSVEIYDENLKKYEEYNYLEYNMSETGFSTWRLLFPNTTSITLQDKYKVIKGIEYPPGMDGNPVYLKRDIKNPIRAMIQQGWRDHAFNEFVSSLIPINRSLPDVRENWCKIQNHFENLPEATVVITFHNEAWSTLLRTVHSVLDRSPQHLLKQIILVDDYSTMYHLKTQLSDYMMNLPKVLLLRTEQREGLIRARILGLGYVTTPVVVFLDSHVECTKGWLEPLLDRIAENPTRVVSPVVDIIHDKTFEYIHQEADDLRIGGFTWLLQFSWETIPLRILETRKEAAAPIKTPTISGGLFAIDMEFFKKLGYFDDGFTYWGADNLELSFKTWMCGGSLEIVPCSHVGHVFRKKFPYYRRPDSTLRNCIRLAEVWLDEYAGYFYDKIGNTLCEYGDVSKRKLLRENLKCKTFKWYLTEVYPEVEIPDDYVAVGKIYGLSGDLLCFDSPENIDMFGIPVELNLCHFRGGNQYWVYTKNGRLKRESLCLTDEGDNSTIAMDNCYDRATYQVWIYNETTKALVNMGSKRCIGGIQAPNGAWYLSSQVCTGAHRQQWKMDKYNADKLAPGLKNRV